MADNPRLRFFGIAAGTTIAILLIANSAADIAMNRWPGEDGYLGFLGDTGSMVLNSIFTAIPFLALALRADERVSMWIAAVVLTTLSWGFAVWQLRQDFLVDFAGGADIGLGIIMTAAPFAILLLLKGLSFVLKWREKRAAR